MEVISSPKGNGSNGVVGMLLRLLLKSDEESVASSHQITRGSPKSRMSQLYVGVNTHAHESIDRSHFGQHMGRVGSLALPLLEPALFFKDSEQSIQQHLLCSPFKQARGVSRTKW
jgi:hypothetical protein